MSNFGSQSNENVYPQKDRVIVRGSYYLTYSNGVLSAWSPAGERVAQMKLDGAGATEHSHFSLSYAAGKVWIVDTAGGTWRGYNIGF